MKGFNISSFVGVTKGIELCNLYKSLGCDTIRWQMNAPFEALLQDRIAYGRWLLEQVEMLLEVANSVTGLRFIADLHSNFGGVVAFPHGISEHHAFLNDFTESQWRHDLAFVMRLIKDCEAILAIELMNEPHARAKEYAQIIRRNKDFFRASTSKRIYISSVYGFPSRLAALPRMGRQFYPTCHFWPTPLSLIGAGGFVGNGMEEQVIRRGNYLDGLKPAMSIYQKKVLIGELGCTRGIGDELQRLYMKKTLAHCRKNRLDTIIHGEADNPAYGYEQTGVLDEVAECFGKKW